MEFEILLKDTRCDTEEIKKYLRKGVKINGEKNTKDGIVIICENNEIGGRPKTLSDEEADKIKRMYFDGIPVKKIAEELNYPRPVIYKLTRTLSEEKEKYYKNRILYMYSRRFTIKTMAEELKLSRQTTSKLLKEAISEED
jgi:DNA-binding transcriptional regulator LsrR (DeoR family)